MTTRIMVIDDEPLICQLLAYQLGGSGYEVIPYQSGDQALLRLAYDQPDLVLLDVMMPGVSGWDLCRQIRASLDVPVIMLTAKSADDDVVTGLNSGADDYICKPFSERQLIARIEAVLRRGAPARARAHAPPPRPAAQSVVAAVAAAAAPLAVALPVGTPPIAVAAPAPPEPVLPRLGVTLAEARHERGMSLHQAERACGVRWEFLQALEQEQFSYMPRSQLRSALNAYSELLGVDLRPYLGQRQRPPRRRRRALPPSLALSVILVMLVLLTLVLLAL